LLSVEGGFDMESLAALLEDFPDNHVWEQRNMFFGGVHTASATRDGMRGTGDGRRGGASLLCNGES
jgi:gamma-glutamyltranspeptidase/glutathione hydrolase